MTDLRRRLAALSAEQRAALAERLAARPAPAREPIAVVGMSCRLPGANGPDELWQALVDGRDEVGPPPPSRGTPLVTEAGYLADIGGFDAEFFGISPREAALMDPQQRLFLEVAWEALERAGVPPGSLAGTATGVFVGIHSHSSDYHLLQLARPGDTDPYTSTGAAHSVVANRLSYLLDLRGPSMAIDTACSSSLVAVHQACLSLRAGESDLAVAGGVNLILLEAVTTAFDRLGILSPKARCRVFDAAADGIARGEGVGAVVLKRLADAERDGDTVLALILASGVNQDGASNGLTAPNGAAQLDLLRKVWAAGGITGEQLAFVETHGTGTSLGDPIEVNALAEAVGRARPSGSTWLGALKSNIGHLEAAAGIAALIKAVLCLRHRAVPGNRHFERLNPQIELGPTSLAVPTRLEPLAAGSRLLGAVSSFGFGGTNAHVCLEAAPAAAHQAVEHRGPFALPLSARSPAGLDALATRWAARLASVTSAAELGDLVHTAAERRTHHPYRRLALGRTAAELRADLETTAPPAGARAADRPGVVFVFTGQGSQWTGMARDLFDAEPVFREAATAFARAYRDSSGQDLLPLLIEGNAELADTALAQPTLALVQIGLTALLRSWGIVPDAVVGHSVGEIAAAHTAGVLDTGAAARVVWHRARLMQELPRTGRMIQVEAPESELAPRIGSSGIEVDVAAINAPGSTVLSGAVEAVAAAATLLRTEGIDVREVPVEYGFHSRLVDAVRTPLIAALEGLVPGAAAVPIVSTVTGVWAEPGSYGPEYWAANVRETVKFGPAVSLLRNAGHSVFVEIGPHPALGASILATAGDASAVATLRRNHPASETLRQALRRLYQAGLALDWKAFGGTGRPDPTAPTNPWQHETFWVGEASPRALVRAVLGRSIEESEGRPDGPLTYAVAWRPSDAPPAGAPSAIAAAPAEVGHAVGRLAAPAGNAATDRERLDRRAAWLVWCALRDFGLGVTGADVGFEALQSRGAAPRFAALWDRCCEQLASAGWAARSDGTWRVVQAPTAETPAVVDRVEGVLLERCGGQLAAVLRGDADPLTLLFPQDGSVGASAIYADTEAAARCNQLAARAVTEAVRAAGGRPLRVVEIGAGTGATTAAVLPLLSRDSRYLATDVSTVFLRDLERRFAGGDHRFETRLFDVERDPAAQQLPVGRADIVIATNVLHATRNLAETAAHARALLAPGGWLVLIETTGSRGWQDLTFGLTAGWDRQEDRELRAGAGLIDAAGWTRLLERSGFRSGVTELDGDPDGVQPYSVLLAQADDRPPPPLAGGWLLLGSTSRPSLVARLEAEGATPIVVELPGAGAGDAAWSELVNEARARFGSRWRGVVLDATAALPSDDGPADEVLDRSSAVLAGVAGLLRVLERVDASPRLWILTRGAQAVTDADTAAPSQALLWGIGRSLALEHPARWGGVIDLDPAGSPETADDDLIVQSLADAEGDDQLAWRAARRWVPRLVPSPPPAATPLALDAQASYLITGATGRLGGKIVRWLASRGARHLVLVGRTVLPDRAQGAALPADTPVARLAHVMGDAEQLGLTVTYVAADVADEAVIGRVFERSAAAGRPIRGIVHAASAHRVGPFTEPDQTAMRRSLTGKVGGALVLHRLAERHGVEFLVSFSSTASVLGGRHMATYAAANQYLDAMAVRGRRRGVPSLSVGWGTFDDVSSLGADRSREVESLGFRPLDDGRAFALLESYLAKGDALAIVADLDRGRLRAAYQANGRRPILDDLEGAVDAAPPAASRQEQGWADAIAGLDADRAHAWLVDRIRHEVANVLGLASPDRVDVERGLFDVGLDSLMAVQLRARLAQVTGVPMPTTLVFNYPNAVAIAGFVAGRLRGGDPSAETPNAAPEPAAPVADDADDAEIRALLRAELSALGSPPDQGGAHGE